jgi:hypothetical protein
MLKKMIPLFALYLQDMFLTSHHKLVSVSIKCFSRLSTYFKVVFIFKVFATLGTLELLVMIVAFDVLV